jgi:hypothetical protein
VHIKQCWLGDAYKIIHGVEGGVYSVDAAQLSNLSNSSQSTCNRGHWLITSIGNELLNENGDDVAIITHAVDLSSSFCIRAAS